MYGEKYFFLKADINNTYTKNLQNNDICIQNLFDFNHNYISLP